MACEFPVAVWQSFCELLYTYFTLTFLLLFFTLGCPTCESVDTGMGDRLRSGIPPPYATNHPGQLSLLSFVGWQMSTGQSAVMRCGWGSKAGWLIPFVDKRVWVAAWQLRTDYHNISCKPLV